MLLRGSGRVNQAGNLETSGSASLYLHAGFVEDTDKIEVLFFLFVTDVTFHTSVSWIPTRQSLSETINLKARDIVTGNDACLTPQSVDFLPVFNRSARLWDTRITNRTARVPLT